MRSLSEILFLLGASSWLNWIVYFLNSISYRTRICVTSQTKIKDVLTLPTNATPQRMAQLIAIEKPNAVVLLSHQDTLLRDIQIMDFLNKKYDIDGLVQSRKAVRLGTNKAFMKEFFTAEGIPTTDYAIANSYSEAYELSEQLTYPVVFKQCDKHEGTGMKIITSKHSVETYFNREKPTFPLIVEKYIDGTEFSIVVCGNNGDYVTLSPVYKGKTSIEGIHPCKRLRIAPPPRYIKNVDKMKKLAINVAKKLEIKGLLELEIIARNEKMFALETNVRLAATMRMACLATGINIFALLGDLTQGRWSLIPRKPANIAIEFRVPTNMNASVKKKLAMQPGIFVTTRITVYGKHLKDLMKRVNIIKRYMNCSSVIAQLHQEMKA